MDKTTVGRLSNKYGDDGWPGKTSPYPWPIVVLNQFIREPSYYIVGFVWKLRGCCRSKKSKPPVLTNEPKQISSSSKTVLFIRHGQGDHNASLPGWNLVDPPLNATGLGQARDLHERLGGTGGPLKDVEVVLVSPLTRAFQTAQGAFGHGPAFQNREPTLKPKWVVCPLLRERMGAPCDEGRPKAQLAMTMPEMKEMEGFDTMKPDVWWTPHFEFGLYDRIAELEEQILSRPESTIAVVGHGGLFTRILGYHLHNCGHQWTSWDAD